jgi:hypothetical protein
VEYLNYDGSTQATYNVPGIDFTGASFAGGSSGTIFAAGPAQASSCTTGSDPFRVAKITTSGIAWTWADTTSGTDCARGSVATTPDGGMIVDEATQNNSAGYVVSLDTNGSQRWRSTITPAAGSLFAAAPMVDTNGVAVIPLYDTYSCPAQPTNGCQGMELEFLAAATGASAFSSIALTNTNSDAGNYGAWGSFMAIASNRVYVTSVPYLDNTTYTTDGYGLAAVAVPGLGQDYRLFLQLG